MDCDVEVTTPGSIIVSPDYPKNHPNNIDCATTIRFDIYEKVVIYFLSFFIRSNLEEDFGSTGLCDYDYLEIRDGNKTEVICGDSRPGPLVLSQNMAHLRFHSGEFNDHDDPSKGFKIKVESGTMKIIYYKVL